jgi:anti-sigma B factor antagonist
MGVAEQLRVDVRREPDRVILALVGELDMASAPLLQSAFEGAALDTGELVVLDLNGLEFIDSTGLRVILAVRKLCSDRGQELAVTRGSKQVERLLSVTGVGDHLTMLESPEAPLDGAGAA